MKTPITETEKALYYDILIQQAKFKIQVNNSIINSEKFEHSLKEKYESDFTNKVLMDFLDNVNSIFHNRSI